MIYWQYAPTFILAWFVFSLLNYIFVNSKGRQITIINNQKIIFDNQKIHAKMIVKIMERLNND